MSIHKGNLDVLGNLTAATVTAKRLLFEEQWDDLRVPALSTKINPALSEPAFESLFDGLFVRKFDTSNADNESVHFLAQIPHSYKEGTDLRPHIHWIPDSTDTGDVFWSFEYSRSNIDGVFGDTITDEIVVPADGVQFKHQIAGLTPIDGTGVIISQMFICRLTRRSTTQAKDTFTGNACFLEFDFHFQRNSHGSNELFLK